VSGMHAGGRRSGDTAGAVGLQAEGLSHSFGGRRVVAGVSLTVAPGRIVGLLGPNGAGKTTTFRMIAGLIPGGEGTVSLSGRRLDGLPLWRRVRLGLGYLPQKPTGFRNLSVADNLRIPLSASGGGEAELSELLEKVGLSHLRDAPAGTLSGGERRRMEIVRCLAAKPSVVLLDEPFAGVDPVALSDIQARIRDLAEAGIGVLITDHAVQQTLRSCDEVIILDAGAIIATGSPAEVAADPTVRSRYLGENFRLESLD
jgi:lipopolysaccharide export system ATP-binding protein